MKKEDLNENYGLYKSLDLEKDQRINIFCKAGGGFIYFTMLVIGYFLSGRLLFFKFEGNLPLLFIQFTLVIILFFLYSILHELVHYITAKMLKINAKWNRDGLSPYTSLENELIESKKYYVIVFSPIVLFTVILIPLQIIVAIFAHDWFWLVWLIIMQNFASSIGDIVAYFLTKKFKKAYLEDSNIKISIYVPKEKFEDYKQMEKAYFEKKAKKHAKKNKVKNLIKDIPNQARKKLDQKENNLEEEDIEDLNKIDM